MIEEYKDYVVNINYPDREIIKMLTLRDEIEGLLLNLEERGTDLEADKVRLETFDAIIRKEMKLVYRKLTASLNPPTLSRGKKDSPLPLVVVSG